MKDNMDYIVTVAMEQSDRQILWFYVHGCLLMDWHFIKSDMFNFSNDKMWILLVGKM